MHYLFLLLKYFLYRLHDYFFKETFYKQKVTEEAFIPYFHPNKKPSWVKDKVMYLKVHLPHDGCRKIAIHFNKQYTHKNMTISKSYVYRIFIEYGYEILQQRKEMRNKLPYKKVKNQMWHMDLTTIDKMQIFGVVDSGMRALLVLKHLPTKSTINIIIALLEAVRDYGKPQSIKSDNEIVFTSRLMRFALWLLNIKRETTQIASPWQNGKIERLFGTMKQSFKGLVFPTSIALQDGLKEFRFFYNHVRMHQNLDYNTPANAWDGKAMSTSKTAREIVYSRGLCDNVAGFYFRE
jgi:hypothetical protein